MGASSAWADVEITETYDFASFITANGTGNLTISGDGIAQSGTSAKVGTVKVIDNLTVNAKTLELNGRFAVDYHYNASSQIRFMWRSDASNWKHGLAGQWNNKGTADPQGAARFSVLNLKAGDKITFTYYKQDTKPADPYTCSASQLSDVAADVALSSGTEYTVAADGNVDLYFTNNNFAIASIVIKTTGTETVSTPTFSITGAAGMGRKVTVTAGSSDAGNPVTTYYTTDGSNPTTSSASFTESSKEITIGEDATESSEITVKAYSVSSTNAASAIGSQAIAVGTTIQLAKPSITLTGMTLVNGYYCPQYTFTSSSVGTYGSPTITLTASFGGNSISNPYTSMLEGTISVVASAEGYADSEAKTLDVDGTVYLLNQTFDFTQDSYREGLSVEGNNITISGAGVQVYRITSANHIEGITLSTVDETTNFGITKAQNYDNRKGLTPRWGSGSITINDWPTGGLATLTEYVGGSIYATSTTGTFSFGSQINYNTFTTLNVYAPATNVIGALDKSTASSANVFGSDIVVANNSAKKLTFQNHGSSYGNNWILKFSHAGEEITSVRADWFWKDGSSNIGSYTYGYTFSSDGGATADFGNVWANYATDMDDAEIVLNLSHIDGKVYINGTMTKDARVYYFNYKYVDGNLTEDVTFNLSVNNCWLEVKSVENADASANPAAPAAVVAPIGNNGYATFCCIYPLDFTSVSDATAWVATACDGEKVTMNQVEGDIYQEKGLILKSATGTTANVTIPIVASSENYYDTNKLVACLGETTVKKAATGTNYVLSVQDDKVVFAPIGNTNATVGARHCYLWWDGNSSARALSIDFSDEATGISSVRSEVKAVNGYYNLAGQRVAQPAKGLYIVNGKKVVIK